MVINYKRLDTLDINFETDFLQLEEQFFFILSNSYSNYYGRDYDKKRIIEGQSILYLAFINELLVGVSYVKRNKRRGATAVYPVEYRRLGLAKKLVELSLIDFPKQYSMLNIKSSEGIKMISLLIKCGFKVSRTSQNIENIVGEEFKQLYNFRIENDYFVFDRYSIKRQSEREFLTLLNTF